ncbi:MAG: MoaD/ThiS family protein [Arenimonas sp.]|uniref:MoaD/ThiS family protein n=1 Tax=Arenimonas sp. TaxID=1872635 RepID=UPI0025BD66EF|nr:MoaD/ThiS family protein [Arenimonas sp.]MBW8367335.1 MoaD/ThiS family protein [Arenimonas sp.]
MSVTVLYFASLREAAGVDRELLPLPASLRALYDALSLRHGFSLPATKLRVAVDGAFVPWDSPLSDGCEIAFIPPVSGG